jgi:hypothetical protein
VLFLVELGAAISVAKAQDSGLVGHSDQASIEMGELAVKRCVVQGLLHRRVRQAKPLLQEVDAQHGLDYKSWTAAFSARARRREGLDQAHQFSPRNNQAHLIEKHTLSCALGDKLESAAGKADLFHACSTSFRPISLSGFCRDSSGVVLLELRQVIGNFEPRRLAADEDMAGCLDTRISIERPQGETKDIGTSIELGKEA